MNRRRFLVLGAGASATLLALAPGPARATPASVRAAMRALIGDAKPQEGRVKLDIPVMVENGNAVSMTVTCEALPGEIEFLHVFAEGNPLPNVIHAIFGPRAARARVATRIRLATSQTVIALVKLRDGTCWTDSVDLLVTLAACLD